jgi:hypothetical protein
MARPEAFALDGGVGIALVVRSLGMLTIADCNVDSLRGTRGNVVIDIGVIAGVMWAIRLKLAMLLLLLIVVIALVGVINVVVIEDVSVNVEYGYGC